MLREFIKICELLGLDYEDENILKIYVKLNEETRYCLTEDFYYKFAGAKIPSFLEIKMEVFFMKFINLTPHEICVMNDEGEIVLKIPPSGKQLRLQTKSVQVASLNGIPVYKTSFILDKEEVKELIKDEDAIYIVSTLLLQALKENDIEGQFIAPNTNPEFVIRDQQGKIICNSLLPPPTLLWELLNRAGAKIPDF